MSIGVGLGAAPHRPSITRPETQEGWARGKGRARAQRATCFWPHAQTLRSSWVRRFFEMSLDRH
jgi:hypothetical protein